MASIMLKWLHRQVSRHGKVTWYVRQRHGLRIRINGAPGSDQFLLEYHAAIRGEPAAPRQATRPAQGTLHWLITTYQGSAAFGALAPDTRRCRRNVLANVAASGGGYHLSEITRAAIIAGRDRRIATPEAANNFVRAMRAMFQWALDNDLAAENPAANIKALPRVGEGYHTWSRDEVERFRDHHPIGTRARLALEMALHTGLRRGDLVRLSPSHIRDGVIEIRPAKTPDVIVTVPLLPPLRRAIDATPRAGLTYLHTANGKPFTPPGFTNWFRDECRSAGVPGSAHGLRKAAATQMAEAGATERQLMAVFGWTSGKQATHYTRAADRRSLGMNAGHLLGQAQNTNAPTLNAVGAKSPKN